MKKALLFVSALLMLLGVGRAIKIAMDSDKTTIKWHRTVMDGSRTGVKSVTVDNVDTALGTFDDETYVAPSGAKFTGGATPEVAAALIEVQPKMAALKQVIGYSKEEMVVAPPECKLSNMFVDEMRRYCSTLFKKEMDFALTNFGGIRCSMPEGAIVLDDILSMFPFKNHLVYAAIKGKNLKSLFDQLALTETFQCISGARVAIKDHKVVSAEIGGKPIEDEKVYNVASIDFLLTGGDRIALGAMAEEIAISDVLLKDMMLEYVQNLTAQGKQIEYFTDSRVTMEN